MRNTNVKPWIYTNTQTCRVERTLFLRLRFPWTFLWRKPWTFNKHWRGRSEQKVGHARVRLKAGMEPGFQEETHISGMGGPQSGLQVRGAGTGQWRPCPPAGRTGVWAEDHRVRRRVLRPDRHSYPDTPTPGPQARPRHGEALKRAVSCAAGGRPGLGCAPSDPKRSGRGGQPSAPEAGVWGWRFRPHKRPALTRAFKDVKSRDTEGRRALSTSRLPATHRPNRGETQDPGARRPPCWQGPGLRQGPAVRGLHSRPAHARSRRAAHPGRKNGKAGLRGTQPHPLQAAAASAAGLVGLEAPQEQASVTVFCYIW